jgi:hypothetical protein
MAKRKSEKRRGEKRHSITKIAGLGIGEYLTLRMAQVILTLLCPTHRILAS